MGRDRSTAAGEHAVPSITSARTALSDDIARRNTRYLWQMSTRVLCFVGAVVVDHWTRWLLLVGAVVLPYVAVVLANAGREKPENDVSPFTVPELPAGSPAGSLDGPDRAGSTRPDGPADEHEAPRTEAAS